MEKFIKIENEELVLRLPTKITSTTTYGKEKYTVDTLCGLAWGDEYSIAYLIYLDYKDNFQAGMPIIILEDREEWEKVCKKFNLMQFDYRKCAFKGCKEILSGCFTINNKGEYICADHY